MFINDAIIFPYGFNKFNIASDYPKLWLNLKIIYTVTFFISSIFIYNFIFNKFINEKINNFLIFKKLNEWKNKKKNIKGNTNEKLFNSNKNNDFKLIVGNSDKTNLPVFIPLKGLYQNILITGTIGSRKNKFCYVSIL